MKGGRRLRLTVVGGEKRWLRGVSWLNRGTWGDWIGSVRSTKKTTEGGWQRLTVRGQSRWGSLINWTSYMVEITATNKRHKYVIFLQMVLLFISEVWIMFSHKLSDQQVSFYSCCFFKYHKCSLSNASWHIAGYDMPQKSFNLMLCLQEYLDENIY